MKFNFVISSFLALSAIRNMKTIFIVSLLIATVYGKFTITANNKRILESLVRHRAKRAWSYPDVSIIENSRSNTYPAGTYLMKIQSDKTDPGITYSVENPPAALKLPTNENVNDWFEMIIETGSDNQNYGALYTKREFDREEYTKWKIQLAAKYANGQNVEDALVIGVNILDVDDNKPKLKQESLDQQFSEKANAGENLFTLQYTDADDKLQGQNAVATFYKVSEYSDGVVSDYLDIMESGVVKLKQKVDYEAVKNIELKVSMTSSGRPMVSPTSDPGETVVVTVVDGNDNAPEMKPVPETEVEETKLVGTTVLTIQATDSDSAAINNAAYFEIIRGDPVGQWRIDNVPSDGGTSFGHLVINDQLDYEPGPRTYNLGIRAYNKKIDGTKDLDVISEMSIQIVVLDVNEPPVFDNDNYQATVKEGTATGQKVIKITAGDGDSGEQKVTYKLSDPYSWFAINEGDGQITVLTPPDREMLDTHVNYNNASDRNIYYNIQVIATDDLAASSTTILKMTIEDQNDEKPILSAGSEIVTICNKGRTTTNVSTLTAYDKDTVDSLPLTIEFAKSAENDEAVANGPWYMDKTSDTTFSLLLAKDREFDSGQQDIELVVVIADKGHLTTTSTVTVKVCDCTGDNPVCAGVLREAGFPIFIIIIIIAILICLIIILAIVVYKRKQAADDAKGGLLYEDEDDVRENLQVYHDEGGGEEDQDAFDITALQQPLEEPRGPRVIDMKPVESAEPQPRLPRNIPGDDIEKYIDDAKAQADKDPTAPPFDSLLVFDYEGTGSDAGSLSSLNSGTTDGSQDYQYLRDWGPRFENLADMYGQGSDTDE